ncbi:Mu transposase C-terminal domain-containing protein [Streptomyces sp. SBR177]
MPACANYCKHPLAIVSRSRRPARTARPLTCLAEGEPVSVQYAALVSAAGYVPVALSPQEYIQLMPREWRVIGPSGVRINNRTYDTHELGPHRRQPSGAGPDGELWEVHYDPYDMTCVWVRNHRGEGWITATWRHLRTSPVPMGELVFDRARQVLAEREQHRPDEEAVAQAAAALLDRAADGPRNALSVGRRARAGQPSGGTARVLARRRRTTHHGCLRRGLSSRLPPPVDHRPMDARSPRQPDHTHGRPRQAPPVEQDGRHPLSLQS